MARNNSMRKELRKHARTPVTLGADIDLGDGSPPRRCSVLDVSEGGARLAVAGAATLPEHFLLRFSRDAGSPCALIWQSGVEVGVMYLGTGMFRAA